MSQTFSANDLPNLLADLKQRRFYGRISLDLKDGDVTLIRKEETVLVNYNQGGATRKKETQAVSLNGAQHTRG